MSLLYLAKKNDEFVSHCKCDESLVGRPGQLDCPWCGWLFSCSKCRKAFSFAKVVEINKTWEELAREDMIACHKEEPTSEEMSDWIEQMQYMIGHIKLGETYIYLDGCFIPANEENFEFEGWHSKHNFYKTPQVIALKDSDIVDAVLANYSYWTENAVQEENT